jgi:hypothetical protein
MKTKVSLNYKDNTKEKDDILRPGDYYYNTRLGILYILTAYGGKYWLTNVVCGSVYIASVNNINDVFNGKKEEFMKIEKVVISYEN